MRSIQRETFNALLILGGIFAAAMGRKSPLLKVGDGFVHRPALP